MDAEQEKQQRSQHQVAIQTHVNGSGSRILAGENNEGNLRAADRSAFQKFKAAAKRIVVTKEVLDMLDGASSNLRTAQKQYEAGMLLPSQSVQGMAAASVHAQQQLPEPSSPEQPHNPAGPTATAAAARRHAQPGGSSTSPVHVAGDSVCLPGGRQAVKKTGNGQEKADWGHFRMLGACRVAPSAAAAVKFSPESSPRPYQPGLSVDAATRASWEAWELMTEEEAIKADIGWRDLLKEKRARMRCRNTEADMRHAAARLIQATWKLHHHRLVKCATAELDEWVSTPRTTRSSRHRTSGSLSPLGPLSGQGSSNLTTGRHNLYERTDDLPAEAMTAAAAAPAAGDVDWQAAIAAAAATSAAAAAAESAAAAARSDSSLAKERQRNAVTYKVKPHVKPAARPQPMSVAVGRDGLAIDTAMPKAKKSGAPKWKAAAHTAMALTALGSADEAHNRRSSSQHGAAVAPKSCSVGQVRTSAGSLRSSTENAATTTTTTAAAAAPAHVRSRETTEDAVAAAEVQQSCRVSREGAAAAAVELEPSVTAAAAAVSGRQGVGSSDELQDSHSCHSPLPANNTSPVVGQVLGLSGAAAVAAAVVPGDSQHCAEYPQSSQAAAEPKLSGSPACQRKATQQQQLACAQPQPAIQEQPFLRQQQESQQTEYTRQKVHQPDQQLAAQALVQDLPVQGQVLMQHLPVPNSSTGISPSSTVPVQYKLTKVQVSIQRKLDSLIPELALPRALQPGSDVATLNASSSSSVASASSAGTTVAAAEAETAPAITSSSAAVSTDTTPAGPEPPTAVAQAVQQYIAVEPMTARDISPAAVVPTASLELAAALGGTAEQQVGSNGLHCRNVDDSQVCNASCSANGNTGISRSTRYGELNAAQADAAWQGVMLPGDAQQVVNWQQQQQAQQLDASGQQPTQFCSSSSSFCSCCGEQDGAEMDQLGSSCATAPHSASSSCSSTVLTGAAAEGGPTVHVERRSESWLASLSFAGGVPAARAIGEAVMSFAGGIVAAATAAGSNSSSSSSGAAGGGLYRGSSLSLTGGWFASKVAQHSSATEQQQHEHQQQPRPEKCAVFRPTAASSSVREQTPHTTVAQGSECSLPSKQQQQQRQQQVFDSDSTQQAVHTTAAAAAFLHPMSPKQQPPAQQLQLPHHHQLSSATLPLFAPAQCSQGLQGALSQQQQQQQQQQEQLTEQLQHQQEQQQSVDAVPFLAAESVQHAQKPLSPRQQQQQHSPMAFSLLQPHRHQHHQQQQQMHALSPSKSPRASDTCGASSWGTMLKAAPPSDSGESVEHSPRVMTAAQAPVASVGLKALLNPATIPAAATAAAAVAGSDGSSDLQLLVHSCGNGVGGGTSALSHDSKEVARVVSAAPQRVATSRGMLKGLIPVPAADSTCMEGVSRPLQLLVGEPAPPRNDQTARAHSARIHRAKSPRLQSIIPPGVLPAAAAAAPAAGKLQADQPTVVRSQEQQQHQLIVNGNSSTMTILPPRGPGVSTPRPSSPPDRFGSVAVAAAAALGSSGSSTGPAAAAALQGGVAAVAPPAELSGTVAQARGLGCSPRAARRVLVSPRKSYTGNHDENALIVSTGAAAAAVKVVSRATAAAAAAMSETTSSSSTGLSSKTAQGVLVPPNTSLNTLSGDQSVPVAVPAEPTAAFAATETVECCAEAAGWSSAQHMQLASAQVASACISPTDGVATATATPAVLEGGAEIIGSTQPGAAVAEGCATGLADSGRAFQTAAAAATAPAAAAATAEAAVRRISGCSAVLQLSSLGQKLAVARRMAQNVAVTAIRVTHQLDGSRARGILAPPALAAAAEAPGSQACSANDSTAGVLERLLLPMEEGVASAALESAAKDSSSAGSSSSAAQLGPPHTPRLQRSTLEADLVLSPSVTAIELHPSPMRHNSASGSLGGSSCHSSSNGCNSNSSRRNSSSSGALTTPLPGTQAGLQSALLWSPAVAGEPAVQQDQPLSGYTIPLKQYSSSNDSVVQLEQQQRLAGRLSNLCTAANLAPGRGPSPVMQPSGPAAAAAGGRLSPTTAAAAGRLSPTAAAGGMFVPTRSLGTVAGHTGPWQPAMDSGAYSGTSSGRGCAIISRGNSPYFGLPAGGAAADDDALLAAADGMSSAAVHGQRRVSTGSQRLTASDTHFDVITNLKAASFTAVPSSTAAAAPGGSVVCVEVGRGGWTEALVGPLPGNGGPSAGLTAALSRQNAGSGFAGVVSRRAATPPPAVGTFAAGLLPCLQTARQRSKPT